MNQLVESSHEYKREKHLLGSISYNPSTFDYGYTIDGSMELDEVESFLLKKVAQKLKETKLENPDLWGMFYQHAQGFNASSFIELAEMGEDSSNSVEKIKAYLFFHKLRWAEAVEKNETDSYFPTSIPMGDGFGSVDNPLDLIDTDENYKQFSALVNLAFEKDKVSLLNDSFYTLLLQAPNDKELVLEWIETTKAKVEKE